MPSPFRTTNWSTILAAREAPSSESRRALEALCQAYWYPVYAYVRRQGHDAEEARDLTQAYFAALLEKGYLDDYDPGRGRFRVFLQASIGHFLSKEREKVRTWKRGGRAEILPLDVDDGESRYRFEPADRVTPEEMFERRWALTVLERALARLRAEQGASGRAQEFDRLEPILTGQGPRVRYEEIAADLGTTEGAIKNSVQRLRQRLGRLLREGIADTVADPDQVDDEVRYLLGVLAPWNRPPG
jgi:RNA polymerase sigma-70 factor (ECF subfamily)